MSIARHIYVSNKQMLGVHWAFCSIKLGLICPHCKLRYHSSLGNCISIGAYMLALYIVAFIQVTETLMDLWRNGKVFLLVK